MPKIVGDVISEAEKYTRGVFELIRFGQRIIFKNQSTANEPKKELKKYQ
ncbi:hypothetical protein [Acidiplasma cupricumulans]|nr:hypothetical protein [Acidiplasma cupricumulans]